MDDDIVIFKVLDFWSSETQDQFVGVGGIKSGKNRRVKSFWARQEKLSLSYL